MAPARVETVEVLARLPTGRHVFQQLLIARTYVVAGARFVGALDTTLYAATCGAAALYALAGTAAMYIS